MKPKPYSQQIRNFWSLSRLLDTKMSLPDTFTVFPRDGGADGNWNPRSAYTGSQFYWPQSKLQNHSATIVPARACNIAHFVSTWSTNEPNSFMNSPSHNFISFASAARKIWKCHHARCIIANYWFLSCHNRCWYNSFASYRHQWLD